MTISVTHSKTLIAPDSGSGDKVYGSDYVDPASHTLNGFGTGVATALAVNVGSAGAPVVNGGALGTPSSGVGTNLTGVPISTAVSGLGTGVAAVVAVNLGTSGGLVTRNGILGTPAAGTLTNCDSLPLAGVSGFGASVATALGIAIGSAGAPVTNGGALGTPSAGNLANCTGIRPTLTAARTYYVRTDGSNSNTGLVNNAGGAFLTVQKAFDVAATIDFGGYVVTISVQAGTFAEDILVPACVGQAGVASLVLTGTGGASGGTIISGSSSALGTINVQPGTKITFSAIRFSSANGSGIYVNAYGYATLGTDVSFGACLYDCVTSAGTADIESGCDVAGNCTRFLQATANGNILLFFGTVAFGTRTFSGETVLVSEGGRLGSAAVTFTGTVTAKRYTVSLNGIAQTYGSGANYFPGNSAGTTATGGQYA